MPADRNKTGIVFNIQKFSVNDGPGIRTVVFLKGCPLRCRWCANPESQEIQNQAIRDREKHIVLAERMEGVTKSVDEVLTEVLQDLPFYEESGGGITLSGGEILMQPDFAWNLLTAAKEEGLHTCCETTGMASPETFLKVTQPVNLLLFDLKHWDEQMHLRGTGVSNRQILENLKQAVQRGKEILIRIPVIPGYNDALLDAKGFSELMLSIGLRECQLLPFHQFGENKYDLLSKAYAYRDVPALHPEDLKEYQQVFSNHGIACFF